jgi:hypothetical protein
MRGKKFARVVLHGASTSMRLRAIEEELRSESRKKRQFNGKNFCAIGNLSNLHRIEYVPPGRILDQSVRKVSTPGRIHAREQDDPLSRSRVPHG